MGVIVAVGICQPSSIYCGKCSTDKATCTECNDGFGLDGATCAGKFLILGNYLLPTIYFNVVILLVDGRMLV